MKIEENEDRTVMKKQVKITIETAREIEKTLLDLIEACPENEADYRSMISTVHELSGLLEEVKEGLNDDGSMSGQDSISNGDSEEKLTSDDSTTSFVIDSPLGPISMDMKQYTDAKSAAHAMTPKPVRKNLFDEKMFNFLGVSKTQRDSRYWKGQLGGLMKLHLDRFLEPEFIVSDEFSIEEGIIRPCMYDTISLQGRERGRIMVVGTRFYESKTNAQRRFILISSVDGDGDHRITIHVPNGHQAPNEPYDFNNLIDQLEGDFYANGPLNRAFFDLKYNFIDRDTNIDNLLAWDEKIKTALWKDIITFQKAMPKLKELGLANSRGVILAGPPGTGKTMIAKWLAAHSDITCILISAEMIAGRQDIKRCYELARKLSPTLLIIEDIDTAGALDRRASDHPLLGEFLQSMDGVVPNHGVITLATTNHSNKIDPAIADRPGRFDRIVEVGLPDKNQRYHILHQHLKTMSVAPTVNREAIERLAKSSDGLTGAWLREIIHTALISSLAEERDIITNDDLKSSLKDILKRRGMAYRVTPYGASGQESANAYVQ